MARKKENINVFHNDIEGEGFTKIYHSLSNCYYLTNEELGQLIYMLSKPDNWIFTQKNILEERNAKYKILSQKELKRILKNLRILGFIKVTSTKGTHSMYKWRTQLSDIPFDPRLFTKAEIKKLQPLRDAELKRREDVERFTKCKPKLNKQQENQVVKQNEEFSFDDEDY